MSLVYVAPLRLAILVLARKGRPWTADAMALMGRASHGQAIGYAQRLCGDRVLVRRADDLYQVGAAFPAWRDKRPRTRPGGHRRETYKAIPASAMT